MKNLSAKVLYKQTALLYNHRRIIKKVELEYQIINGYCMF